jgi:hypothetical protein
METFDFEIPYQDRVPGKLHQIFPDRYENEGRRETSAEYTAEVVQEPHNTDEPVSYVLEEAAGTLRAQVDEVADQSVNFDVNINYDRDNERELQEAVTALEGIDDIRRAFPILHQSAEGLVGESTLRDLERRGVNGEIRFSRDTERHIEEDVNEILRYNPGSQTFEYIAEDREARAREKVEQMNPVDFGEDYSVYHVDKTEQRMRTSEVEEALEEIGLEVA